ncbi:hypothetical protein [Singulisphaera sp. PoT]|uniref:hypothetical protein n=1 Tax=Singulisphaera sp. PoT TaxID=3411797 RepID=UPI003BF4D63E
MGGHRAIDAVAGLGELKLLDQESGQPRLPFKRPCSGPSCSQAPLAPAPTPAPVSVFPRMDQWGCLASPPSPPSLSTRRLLASDDVAQPTHVGVRLDRPPRAA